MHETIYIKDRADNVGVNVSVSFVKKKNARVNESNFMICVILVYFEKVFTSFASKI